MKKLGILVSSFALSLGVFVSTSHAEENIGIPDDNNTYVTNDKVEIFYDDPNTESEYSTANDTYPRTSGWDYVGTDYGALVLGQEWGYTRTSDKYKESTGGDFKISFMYPQYAALSDMGSSSAFTVQLWEEDGANGENLVGTLGTVKMNGTLQSFVYPFASSWVDGTNKRAEFFITVRGISGSVSKAFDVKFYD